MTDQENITTYQQAVAKDQSTIAAQQLTVQANQANLTVTPATISQDEATVAQDQVTVTTDTKALANTTLRASISGTVTAVNGSVGETVGGSGSTTSGSTAAASSGSSGSSSTGGSSPSTGSGATSTGSGSTGTSSAGSGSSGTAGSSGSSGAGSSTGSSSSSSSSSSSALVSIESLGSLEVVANYAEADATKIAVGQPATITMSALSSTEVSGVVTAVSPTSSVVSNVVTYPVTVALTNPPSTVKEGMTAQVAVIVQTANNVLQLPSAAITTTGSISTVKVLSNGRPDGHPCHPRARGQHLHRDHERPARRSDGGRANGERECKLERVELDGRRRRVPRRRLRWRGPVVASDTRMGPDGSPRRWPVIALSNIVKRYVMGGNDVYATRGVSLSVSRGEFVAIMGASGSGKSTLMNIIGCLDVPTSGHYRLDGVNIRDLDDRELSRIRNRKIGFVFQGFNLLPTMSAIANVELPMAYAGVPTKERRHRAEGALESVGLADRMGHFPNEMSGGQQQRVAVARAIVTNPSLILADEPTGNLDSTSSVDVMSAFASLHAQGRTVVMITHEEDIAAYATRVVRLRDGVITQDYHQTPAHPHESHLAHARQAEGSSALAGRP